MKKRILLSFFVGIFCFSLAQAEDGKTKRYYFAYGYENNAALPEEYETVDCRKGENTGWDFGTWDCYGPMSTEYVDGPEYQDGLGYMAYESAPKDGAYAWGGCYINYAGERFLDVDGEWTFNIAIKTTHSGDLKVAFVGSGEGGSPWTTVIIPSDDIEDTSGQGWNELSLSFQEFIDEGFDFSQLEPYPVGNYNSLLQLEFANTASEPFIVSWDNCYLAGPAQQSGLGSVTIAPLKVSINGNILQTNASGFELYNVSGVLLANSTDSTMDVSDLAKGLYIVKTDKGTTKVVK